MHELMRRKMEGLERELIDFTRALLRTRSVSGDELRAADLVAREMDRLGYDKVVRDDFGNVSGIIYGVEDGPAMLLCSHLDTVSAGAEEAWAGSPWSGDEVDGRLTGLGAADCKGGVAAQVYAGALLKRCLLPLRGHLIVSATVTEENGLSLGTRGLVEVTLPELGMKPAYALLGEPTDLGLYHGHDGWAEIEITVQGTNPFQVSDAAQTVCHGMTAVNGSVSPSEMIQELLVGKPRFDEQSGLRRATIDVRRRVALGDREEALLGRLRHDATVLARAAGVVQVDVALRRHDEKLATGVIRTVKRISHAWSTDPWSPLMTRARQSLAAAGLAVRPGRWQLDRLGMGTAGDLLVNQLGIPTLGYGPGQEERAHQPGESVEARKVVECAYGSAAIAHGMVGVPVFGWIPDEF